MANDEKNASAEWEVSLRDTCQTLLLPVDSALEAQAVEAVSNALAADGIPEDDRPVALDNLVDEWRSSGQLPDRLKPVVKAALRAGLPDPLGSQAGRRSTADSRLDRTGPTGGIYALASRRDSVSRAPHLRSGIRARHVSRAGSSYHGGQKRAPCPAVEACGEQILTACGVRLSMTDELVQASWDNMRLLEEERFADADEREAADLFGR